jgi:predicted phosphodiesterase
MKQVVIPDVHGLQLWKRIVENHKDADRIIFLGDYMDSFTISGLEQVKNLREIIAFKEQCESNNRWKFIGAEVDKSPEVILLIGNHDHHYFPWIGYTGTSGYQPTMSKTFEYEFETYQKMFQMAFIDENELVLSHAGITESFLYLNGIGNTSIYSIVDVINDMFIHKPKIFTFYPGDKSGNGNHIFQSPIWVRPESLYKDGIKQIQIVGHTPQPKINPKKSKRQGYWLTDVMNSTKEYLVIIDGKITIDRL